MKDKRNEGRKDNTIYPLYKEVSRGSYTPRQEETLKVFRDYCIRRYRVGIYEVTVGSKVYREV